MADLAPLSFSTGGADWQYNPKFHDFATFLGLTERDAKGVNWKADRKTRQKLEQLYFWGRLKANSTDHEKIKEQVFNLQRSVGVNWTGKLLIDRLHQHTIFDKKFQGAMEKFIAFQNQPAKPSKEKKKEDLRAKPTKSKPVKKVKVKYETFDSDIEIKKVKMKTPETHSVDE